MIFNWDPLKAKNNLKKHKVSFEEASTTFGDKSSVTFYDDIHSVDEDRYLLIGRSNHGRLLVVTYTEKKAKIRLISSRLATRRERKFYENQK